MTDGTSQPLILTEHGTYAIITLNRPAQLNCLTQTMMEALADALAYVREKPELRSLIVTGAGGAFSSGADLGEVAALKPAQAAEFSRRGQTLLSAISESVPVSIAAIDGVCMGGGLDLALSCDLRYGTPRSSFAHPGAKRGLITGWGGTQRLPRLIGLDAARRMFLTGERIDAHEAQQLGLLNRICDDALGYACQLAERWGQQFTGQQMRDFKVQFQT
ncbi:MAG: enoyl-CoA hydratase/isomerase family protein [Acidobacteria bacterium]|nr:enoyl-CoA hydratase/isomerase family protein [Acidobacteriota bacterium]